MLSILIVDRLTHELLILHVFNGLFFMTSWVSRHQTGKTSLDLNEARGDRVLGCQWHQLDHMQTVCTLLKTDNDTNTSSLNFYRLDALHDTQSTVSKCWKTDTPKWLYAVGAFWGNPLTQSSRSNMFIDMNLHALFFCLLKTNCYENFCSHTYFAADCFLFCTFGQLFKL